MLPYASNVRTRTALIYLQSSHGGVCLFAKLFKWYDFTTVPIVSGGETAKDEAIAWNFLQEQSKCKNVI
jgi:hypothetical protein